MILASLVAALSLTSAARADSDPALERALTSELTRAKRELKAEGYPRIYFAAATVWELEDWDRWSAMGAPRAEGTMRQRILLPEVRVGSPALDNHPLSPRGDYLGTPISIQGDEFALRHAIWRVFDGAYKSATSDFLRKQALVVSKGRAEYDTDDFASEPAVSTVAASGEREWDVDRLRRLEEALAEPLRRIPAALYAESHVGLRRLIVRRRDTDGTSVDEIDDVAKIEVEVAALAPDGIRETTSREWLAATPAALPTEAEMRRAGRAMAVDMQELRTAISTSPFSAPTLIDPSVSGALIYSLAQRLSGEEMRNPNGAQTFRGRIGERILDSTLSIVDDPTQDAFRGKPLFGAYDFDDEGVPARRVQLVDRGVLTGLLLSRYPVKGFPRSNGHGRAGVGMAPSGAPGALALTSTTPSPLERLLFLLREECRRRRKPYGLWVRNLRSAVQQQSSGGQGSIRFLARVDLVDTASGRTIRVRDLDLVGTPLVMAGSILASGDDAEASDLSTAVRTSVVAPSLLLAEAELQRSESKPEKAPILPAPQPFIPQSDGRSLADLRSGFVQINRYRLADRTEPIESFDAAGVAAWRQTPTADGLVLDAAVVGKTRAAAVAAGRRVDTAAAALVRGGAHKSILFPLAPAGALRARFDGDWPDDGPR